MLSMTPEYAALREKRARETIRWLEGNFAVKRVRRSVVARMDLAGPISANVDSDEQDADAGAPAGAGG
jgi:hypothetical protein